MKPIALFGALAGGVLGALLWGGIAHLTGYEVGYVAWAVGGVVGFGAVALGGRGPGMAFTCAMLSLVAIFAGKVIAIHASAEQSRIELAKLLPEELYNDNVREAPMFARLRSEAEWPRFMVENGYSEATHPDGVSEEELRVFGEIHVPVIERMSEGPLAIDEWRTVMAERQVAYVFEHVGTVALVQQGMTFVDIVFAILGIMTAGGIVMRATEEYEHRERLERQKQTDKLAEQRAREYQREPAEPVGV